MDKYNVVNREGNFEVEICDGKMDDFLCESMGIVQFETIGEAYEYAAFMNAVESGNGDFDVVRKLGIMCYTFDEFEECDEFIYNWAGYIAVLLKSNRVYYVDPELKEVTQSDDLDKSPLSDFKSIKDIMDMLKAFHENDKCHKFDKYKNTPKIVLKIKEMIGKETFIEFKNKVYDEFGNSYNWKPENEEKLIELANQFAPQYN